ncbi:hypothetical protein HXX76_011735 [Chlamydomonas incerta]|uniref:Uncharacterized protein n=1 Tax=Chlamydomonas incerta TaxID=51695 RepID=A0A835VUN5_CHLIN|nr:hypothetical protein HXX76_011735 [Chlamydomonas incerta]|eukprot:KAG2426508.1 hypothetical protein HXX76_011735 [Chlamydomonas incerta]
MNLLDVLRHLDVEALGSIFGGVDKEGSTKAIRGARLSCRALRDIVNGSVTHAVFRVSPSLLATWRPGQQSLLARFRRCSHLTVALDLDRADGEEPSDEDEEPQQPQSLLAALCVSGVEPSAAAGSTHLRLTSDAEPGPQLRTLALHAITLAGWLRNVRELDLDSCNYGDSPGQNRATYTALRAALPRLETLVVPAIGFLPGLEAFAGSGLATVRVSDKWYEGFVLDMSCVRSLQQLTQLRRLEIGGLDTHGISLGSDVGQAAEAAAAEPGCEDDEATLAGLCTADAEQLLSLRRLLVALPAALESLKLRRFTLCSELLDWPFWHDIVLSFSGGELISMEVGCADGVDGLNFMAAALLPRLLRATPGQRRLPLLRLVQLNGDVGRLRERLQPCRPLVRLLGLCDRVEFKELRLNGWLADPDATAATVRAVVQVFGRPSGTFLRGQHGFRFVLPMETKGDRKASGCSGDGGAGGAGCVTGVPQHDADVVSALGEALLSSATEWIWQCAAADGGPALAAAAAQDAEGAAAREGAGRAAQGGQVPSAWQGLNTLLLRGPLVTQQLFAGIGGAAGLTSWLDGLLAQQGHGESRALVRCDAPWRLVAVLAAAGALTAGQLEASALRGGDYYDLWGYAIMKTVESPSWCKGVPAGACASAGAGGHDSAAGAGGVGACGARQPEEEPAGGEHSRLADEVIAAEVRHRILLAGQAFSKVLWAEQR